MNSLSEIKLKKNRKTFKNQKCRSNEKLYIDRSEIVMDRNKELEFAQKKLKIWNEFFIKNDIECFDLSNLSNTPFQKEKLNHILTKFS